MYNSGSCDGATHVLLTLPYTCCMSYVQYLSTAAAQTATYTYVVYCRRKCDMYSSSSSSCDGATHVLLSTLLRTVCITYNIYSSSCCGPTFLRNYAVGHRITVCTVYSQSFYKQTEQCHSFRQISRFSCDPHPYTSHFPPSTFPHHHPPPARRHNRWTP